MAAEFARAYEITPDADLPSGLASHRIYDFAPDLRKPTPSNYQIRFTTKSGKWTGVFAGEFRGLRNKVLGCPLPNEACVISGGLGYWFDVEISQNYNVLRPLPIIYAEEVPAIGGLLIADYTRACVLTGMHETAWNKKLFVDGFDSINVTGTILTFRHQPYYGSSQREVIVDLMTGEVLREIVMDSNSIG
jgi:hypothetical protein